LSVAPKGFGCRTNVGLDLSPSTTGTPRSCRPEDAEQARDQELAEYFREVVEGTKRGADRGKTLLAERLQAEG